jgi:LPS export ABC transporter permease LptF/LPS export ABC transporter permease LptG
VRILTRYILKEILWYTLLGVVLFTFVVFMREMGRLLELIVRNSASVSVVLDIFALLLPTVLIITIPMSVLVGVLLGLGRLAADSEITAMRASGIGSWRLVRTVSLLAAGAWAVAFFNNVYLAPRSAAALAALQDRLKTSQVGFEVQPHVFYEDFKNYVLYVQDTTAARGVAEWKGVFLADVSQPADPKVTLARDALVSQQSPGELRVHLENGSEHSLAAGKPDQYEITTFSESDIPVQIPTAQQQSTPTAAAAELPTRELDRLGHSAEPQKARSYLIEYHRRLALPAACIVLTIVGLPLGISARRGGKATGFILAIVLVFVYYFISLAGIALARQGKVPPAVGVWPANVIFLLLGIVLLLRVDKRPLDAIGWVRTELADLRTFLQRLVRGRLATAQPAELGINGRSLVREMRRRRLFPSRFPQLIDEYIVRDFALYAFIVLASFVVLFLVFTLFELLTDILRNGVAMGTVGEYLLDLIPWTVYLFLPLAVLVAVLVTFGLMARANEITALKATGISVYRVATPVLIIGAILAGSIFVLDQLYIPRINRRQETLRNRIKGKPPQTYLRPERRWIFGEHHNIYYYQFYDGEQESFVNLTVFEFDPASFQVTRRITASHAHWEPTIEKWVFEKGWQRQFEGSAIAGYSPFEVASFPELNEKPQYFRKEVKQYQEMNYDELRHYISDLQQSGFDVVRLKVQLYKKLAYPLITLVMSGLAIPFALSGGRRGALSGVATALGIAIVYFVIANLFESMGNVGQLPAVLAAWSPDILFALGGGYLLLKVPT